MANPEYYQGALKFPDGKWVTTKYGDAEGMDVHSAVDAKVWERRPLYCVPIPGQSAWSRAAFTTPVAAAPPQQAGGEWGACWHAGTWGIAGARTQLQKNCATTGKHVQVRVSPCWLLSAGCFPTNSSRTSMPSLRHPSAIPLHTSMQASQPSNGTALPCILSPHHPKHQALPYPRRCRHHGRAPQTRPRAGSSGRR